jgi:predicted tellurium resistance membrane protein TerC
MASKTKQQVLLQTWWVRGLLGIVFLLVAYGFVSLAIDSGSWLEYAIAIILIWFGVKDILRSVRLIFVH